MFAYKYILDDQGNPVCEPDVSRWGAWFANGQNRLVQHDQLPGDVVVSTVFLGINHRSSRRGPPLLWETMIFGGPHHGYCVRYVSRTEARAGHRTAVNIAQGHAATA